MAFACKPFPTGRLRVRSVSEACGRGGGPFVLRPLLSIFNFRMIEMVPHASYFIFGFYFLLARFKCFKEKIRTRRQTLQSLLAFIHSTNSSNRMGHEPVVVTQGHSAGVSTVNYLLKRLHGGVLEPANSKLEANVLSSS
jgi:hypothetical protein